MQVLGECIVALVKIRVEVFARGCDERENFSIALTLTDTAQVSLMKKPPEVGDEKQDSTYYGH